MTDKILGPVESGAPTAAAPGCWRVDMTIATRLGAIEAVQCDRALGRGVRIDAAGRWCQATFSVTADDVAVATRVALARWTHLVEELRLSSHTVEELHIALVPGHDAARTRRSPHGEALD